VRRKARVSWRNVDKRMQRAADLRQCGLSLRAIADVLAVGEATVRRDLARWESLEVEGLLRQMTAPYGYSEGGMAQQDDAAGSGS
jgi:transposase